MIDDERRNSMRRYGIDCRELKSDGVKEKTNPLHVAGVAMGVPGHREGVSKHTN